MPSLARSLSQTFAVPAASHWLHHASPSQLFFLAYGFLPIGCLSLALQDRVPLHVTAAALIVPASIVALLVGTRSAGWGRQAAAGLLSGIIAVALYDLVRLSFVLAGVMSDPIPGIGRLALNDPSASAVWGYAWRFMWNGGAMGISFAMLPFRGARAGALFGTFVCGCLFATLAISPIAQHRFLALTPLNMAIALVGHIVYGAALGASLGWTATICRRDAR